MTVINPHTTRGTGTVLTAAIYNADHNNHVTNATNLNADKLERSGSVTPGHAAVWVDDESLEDGGVLGTMAAQAAADYAALAGTNAFTGANTFSGAHTLESADAGATEAPNLILRRNSASPAASDLLGRLLFRGRNLTPADFDYAALIAQIIDETAGSEDARLLFRTAVAGTLATRMSLANGLAMTGASGADQGAGTINATEYYKNGVRGWTTIVKSADQTGSNTTLINDSELLVPVLASTDYWIRGAIFFDTPTAADFKYSWAGPAAPTLVNLRDNGISPDASTLSTIHRTAFGATQNLTGAAGTFGTLQVELLLKNGVNAGNIQFQFAQVTNSGTTTIRKGSYLEYRQL